MRQFAAFAFVFELLAGLAVTACNPQTTLLAEEPVSMSLCDEAVDSCDFLPEQGKKRGSRLYRTPAMIGDFFGGSSLRLRGNSNLDSLMVLANDLDAPLLLPAPGSTLNLSEPGPLGIFATSLGSLQELQALLRSGAPIPGLTLAGSINDNATLTTTDTISQIQNQLAGTPEGYDIISIAAPPGSYDAAVLAAFMARNTVPGLLVYNTSGSGALLQGGVDTLLGGEDFDAFYFYDYVVRFDTNLADATSGGVGRLKIAEGGTVLPQDRIFCRYSHISGVSYTNDGVPLNRFVPGFEKSLMGGLISLELRAPFATDAATSTTLDGQSFSTGSATRFGNLTTYFKALLIQRETLAVSGGLGVAMPTASDIRVNYVDGTPLMAIQNESVRLQPFIGGLFMPSNDLFVQGFLQYDVAANGNSVSLNSTGNGLTQAGVLTDSSNLFIDAGLGYWLYRSDADTGLTGIIPTLEIHQNSMIGAGDIISSGAFQIGNFAGQTSLTNLTAGSTFEFARRSNLSVAYTGPIGGGADRQFNGGLQVLFSSGW